MKTSKNTQVVDLGRLAAMFQSQVRLQGEVPLGLVRTVITLKLRFLSAFVSEMADYDGSSFVDFSARVAPEAVLSVLYVLEILVLPVLSIPGEAFV